jgi:hypothetical protein
MQYSSVAAGENTRAPTAWYTAFQNVFNQSTCGK